MNITLRTLKKEDKRLFYAWWNDQELRALTSGNFDPIGEAEINQTLGQHLVDKNGRDFIIEADKKPIGHILISKDKNEKYFAIYIAIGEKDYWNKGYGPEALRLAIDWFWQNHLQEQILELEVNQDNPRAFRCYEKVGFKKIKEKKYQDSPNTFLMRLQREKL